MKVNNDSKSKLDNYLSVLNNRISNNLLVYVLSVALIINAYLIGTAVSIKNRPDNSIFISDIITDKSDNGVIKASTSDSDLVDKKLIFGSSKGKYFYYKGCEATNLSPNNLVYYKSEDEAKSKGKILHKSCE